MIRRIAQQIDKVIHLNPSHILLVCWRQSRVDIAISSCEFHKCPTILSAVNSSTYTTSYRGMSPDRPSLVRVRHQRSAVLSCCKGKPPMSMVSPHKGTIMWKMREITNVLLFAFKIVYYFASSIQLMTWILLHIPTFHPLERFRWSLALIWSLPMGLSPSL